MPTIFSDTPPYVRVSRPADLYLHHVAPSSGEAAVATQDAVRVAYGLATGLHPWVLQGPSLEALSCFATLAEALEAGQRRHGGGAPPNFLPWARMVQADGATWFAWCPAGQPSTTGRYVMISLGVREAVIRWCSGTGHPSRFIGAMLHGCGVSLPLVEGPSMMSRVVKKGTGYGADQHLSDWDHATPALRDADEGLGWFGPVEVRRVTRWHRSAAQVEAACLAEGEFTRVSTDEQQLVVLRPPVVHRLPWEAPTVIQPSPVEVVIPLEPEDWPAAPPSPR